MGYFKTKVERVETEFTEEEMEKWERKRKIEECKEREFVKRLKTRYNMPYSGLMKINKSQDIKKAMIVGHLVGEKKKEEVSPSLSQKGPFTYETHSCKETVELLASIRDTSPRGTIINWVNDEKKIDSAIYDALFTPNSDSAWRYERKWFNGDIAEVVMLYKLK